MKKLLIILCLLVATVSYSQNYLMKYIEVELKDTIYFYNDLLSDTRDKNSRIATVAFYLDEVWAACSDAIIEPGIMVCKDNTCTVKRFLAFEHSNYPYTVIAADTSYQPDGTYENWQGCYVDRLPAPDGGVRMNKGSCSGTIMVGIWIYYGVK